MDPQGGLIAADNLRNLVLLRVDPGTRTVTIVAGGGSSGTQDGVKPTDAGFLGIAGLALDARGRLHIADVVHQRLRRVKGETIRTVFGGGAQKGVLNDVDGTAAQPGVLGHLAADAAGNVFVSEVQLDCVYKLTPEGRVFTIAGQGVPGNSLGGGQASQASLNDPDGLVVDRDGSLYIADAGNGRVLKVSLAPAVLRGDANGDGKVSILDVLLCLRALAGLQTLSSAEVQAADVGGKPGVDILDVLALLRAVPGLQPL